MANYIISDRITNEASLALEDMLFSRLQGNFGGAVYNKSNGELTLSHISFEDNIADSFGGAIFSEGKIASADDIEFSGNSAYSAGALYSSQDANFTNVSFVANTASNIAGALDNWGQISFENSDFKQNSAKTGGCVFNGDEGVIALKDCTISGNSALYDGGFAENYGTIHVTDCSFTGNTARQGGALDNLGKVALNNVTFSGNEAEYGGAIYNGSEHTVSLENVSFLTQSDTIVNKGKMSFAGTISIAGRLETSTVINAKNAALVFDISTYTAPNEIAIVNDLSRLDGVGSFAVTVNASQKEGDYMLADNASAFSKSMSVKDADGAVLATLSVGDSQQAGNTSYSLTRNDAGSLSLSVLDVSPVPENLTVTGNLLGWTYSGSTAAYELELVRQGASGGSAINVLLNTKGAELVALPENSYGWRVRAEDGKKWSLGNNFTSTALPSEPQYFTAETNSTTDLLFARVDGVWTDKYFARHVGNNGGWNGTGDVVALAGKARIADIFTGSEDASILMLDAFGDNSESGVALFLEDIYSAAPDTAAQARIASINEICAGSGDDVIDLTSRQFAFESGVIVHGGAGDDVIWANSGENTLFGGDGDDSIIGGSGDDVIDGGAGNDVLHGGGGDDTFCFYGAWGQDTVEQLSYGSVTLCFADGNASFWNAETLTYDDGVNSVCVKGASTATVLFNSELAKKCQINSNLVGALD